MDPISLGIVIFGFYKIIQFITKEDEVKKEENDDNEWKKSPKEIPYNN